MVVVMRRGSSARTRAARNGTRRTAGCRYTFAVTTRTRSGSYEDCRKSFVRNSDLNVHIQRVHETNRKYKCEVEGCDKSFVSQGELRRHTLTHHHFGESVSINLMPDEAI